LDIKELHYVRTNVSPRQRFFLGLSIIFTVFYLFFCPIFNHSGPSSRKQHRDPNSFVSKDVVLLDFFLHLSLSPPVSSSFLWVGTYFFSILAPHGWEGPFLLFRPPLPFSPFRNHNQYAPLPLFFFPFWNIYGFYRRYFLHSFLVLILRFFSVNSDPAFAILFASSTEPRHFPGVLTQPRNLLLFLFRSSSSDDVFPPTTFFVSHPMTEHKVHKVQIFMLCESSFFLFNTTTTRDFFYSSPCSETHRQDVSPERTPPPPPQNLFALSCFLAKSFFVRFPSPPETSSRFFFGMGACTRLVSSLWPPPPPCSAAILLPSLPVNPTLSNSFRHNTWRIFFLLMFVRNNS